MPPTPKKRRAGQPDGKPPVKRAKPQSNTLLRRSRRVRGLPATPPVELLDLPPEVFQNIMRFVVEDVPKALDARLVSHAFNQEIEAEIFWSAALDSSNHLERLTMPWRARLLLLKATSHRHYVDSVFFQMLRDVFGSILEYLGDHSTATMSYWAQTVTALPAFFNAVVSDRRPQARISRRDINRGCICISAFVGDYQMYRHFQARETTPFQDFNRCFGSPAWAAALSGKWQFLHQMRVDGIQFHQRAVGGTLGSAMIAACSANDAQHKQAATIILDAMIAARSIDLADLTAAFYYAQDTRHLPLFWLLTDPYVITALKMELESVLHADEEDQASDIIKLLLIRGVDPNTRAWSNFNHVFGSHSFSTPLQNAVVHRRPSRLNLLLSHGADPNFAGWPNQRRPIEVAISHQSPDLVNALLYHGATKHTPPRDDDDPFNILTHPAAAAHLPTWHECLAHFDLADADTPDYAAAHAALLHAARRARPDLIAFLVACGVGIHGRWDPPLLPLPAAAAATPDLPRHACLARPAIVAALEAGDRAMVEFLLVRGAVWHYPIDYQLRAPGESADDVDRRVAGVRRRAWEREYREGDGRIERSDGGR